ncbi:MAG: hypothetical protein SGI73_14650 [Chloroflexota bacterium]|nr:hypothetical protein [Chloroflexota bacterium]
MIEPREAQRYYSAAVHTTNGSNSLTANDTLDSGDVLPDFALCVVAIFPT